MIGATVTVIFAGPLNPLPLTGAWNATDQSLPKRALEQGLLLCSSRKGCFRSFFTCSFSSEKIQRASFEVLHRVSHNIQSPAASGLHRIFIPLQTIFHVATGDMMSKHVRIVIASGRLREALSLLQPAQHGSVQNVASDLLFLHGARVV
jgi:hypothetical protein